MIEFFLNFVIWMVFFMLMLFEFVFGIDNIVFIMIFVDKLLEE